MTPEQRAFHLRRPWFRQLHRSIHDAGLGIGPYSSLSIDTICKVAKIDPSTYYRARAEWSQISTDSPIGQSAQAGVVILSRHAKSVVPGVGAQAYDKYGSPVNVLQRADKYTWAGLVAHVAGGMSSRDSSLFLRAVSEAVKSARAVKTVREGRVDRVTAMKIASAAARVR